MESRLIGPVQLRVTLLCMLLVARHCYFVLEHPAQTLLIRHPRWEEFVNARCWEPCLTDLTSCVWNLEARKL